MQAPLLQTVERALVILEILSETPMTAVQIQRKLNLNKSTAHRLLTTLSTKGFVEKNPDTGVYSIGLKVVEIGSIRLNKIELKTEAAPYLRKLAEKAKQPVQLATYSNGDAVYIEKIEHIHTIRMYSQIGKRIPVYCSAVGKALILDMSDQEIEEILSKINMKSYTPTTLTTTEEVLDEIHLARKTGWTVDNEEHELGIYCIAAPIYDYRGKIVAAISTAGSDKSFLIDSNAEIIDHVKLTADNISKRMGYSKKQEATS